MLTKNRNKNSVREFLNSDINLMFITENGFVPYEIEETNLTVEEPELTVKEKNIILVREYVKNRDGFTPSDRWIKDFLCDYIVGDDSVIDVLDYLLGITKESPFDKDKITVEVDIETKRILLSVKESLDETINLKNRTIPYVREPLDESRDFEFDCLINNTEQIRVHNFFSETITPEINYKRLFEFEYFYCNLMESMPINEYFRAFWLFMWFEKRDNMEIPNLTYGLIPKDAILEYLATKFSLKDVYVESIHDLLYELYLQVQPYLVQYFEIENSKRECCQETYLNTVQPVDKYETILDWEYYYCNMRDSSPINEYFRAYWLFMWFEKRATVPMPSIVLETIPKETILKYLDTRFSVKHLKEGSTKRDYFYELYLKVQPYLIHYFALEKFEQKELFSYEI